MDDHGRFPPYSFAETFLGEMVLFFVAVAGVRSGTVAVAIAACAALLSVLRYSHVRKRTLRALLPDDVTDAERDWVLSHRRAILGIPAIAVAVSLYIAFEGEGSTSLRAITGGSSVVAYCIATIQLARLQGSEGVRADLVQSCRVRYALRNLRPVDAKKRA